MGMKMFINAAEREKRGPTTDSGIRLPTNRGFMDDMPVIAQNHIKARWVLGALDETVSWARLTFKPRKSRCLVVKKGIVTDKFNLFIQGEVLP